MMTKLSVIVTGTLLCAGPLLAQTSGEKGTVAKEKAAPAAEKAAAQMPPSPKPGPEHANLKKLVGTWDATVEMVDGSAPPSKGTETNTAIADGLWIVTDFKSQMGPAPFEGHGVEGYDTTKKKYVSTWVDSMTTSVMVGEGTYDAASKTATDTIEGPGPDGKPMKMKATTEWKDDDTRVFTMFNGEKPSMKITYKRRK
jgi:hypothetical protein